MAHCTQILLWRHTVSRYVSSVDIRVPVCVGIWRWLEKHCLVVLKGGLLCVDFHETLKCSAALRENVVYWTAATLDNKCAKYRHKFSVAFTKVICETQLPSSITGRYTVPNLTKFIQAFVYYKSHEDGRHSVRTWSTYVCKELDYDSSLRLPEFLDSRHMKVVRLSAFTPSPLEIFLIFIAVTQCGRKD
jgi:hypothetical protein